MSKKTESKAIPMSIWGKDHWSLLAYLETRNVDYGGAIAYDHLRRKGGQFWKPECSTRIRISGGKQEPLPYDHDDFDVIEDFEAAGLADRVTGTGSVVKLTEAGIKLAHKLRRHKIAGGSFGTFKLDE